MNNMLSHKRQRELEELWLLRREAVAILRLVLSEWESDPLSVQCFDLRIIERAKVISKRIRELDPLDS
jgi:hypothetical protein